MMELAKESINFAFWETAFEHVNLNSRGKFTLDGNTEMHSETFDDHNLERVCFIACFWTKNDKHVQISFVINMASFQISDVEWTVY